jgi:lipoyl(octanoyl) transferase
MKNCDCQVRWLGQMSYDAARQLQRELAAQRKRNEIPNTLLLLEHPVMCTIGLGCQGDHLLASQARAGSQRVTCHRTDRRGAAIYHGPGQLVGYPILNLRDCGCDYHDYVRLLEEVIIQTLFSFKVRSFRGRGSSEVWVLTDTLSSLSPFRTRAKPTMASIGAVGVSLDWHDITQHGFFLNVNLQPDEIDLMLPCHSYPGHITSLQQVLNRPIEFQTVIQTVWQTFCQVFKMNPLADYPAVADHQLSTEAFSQPVSKYGG